MSGERKSKIECSNENESRSCRGSLRLVRSALTIACLSLATTAAALAQSAYIHEGQSGWEVSGQFAAGSGFTSGSVTVGHSSKGLVDAVVSISRSSFPNPYPFDFVTDGRIITGTAFSETFTAFIVKQDRGRYPISLAISGGCCLGSFSSPKSQTEQEMQVDNGYICYGASIYREFRISDIISIQPSLRILYWQGFGSVAERYYGVQAGNHYMRSLIACVQIAIPISQASILVMSPAFAACGKQSVVSIGAGFVFLTNDGQER